VKSVVPTVDPKEKFVSVASEGSAMRNLITDVPGVQVGNAEDPKLASGVTAIIFDEPAVASGDVRGGAPFRQAAVAREEGDTAREGSQTGDASGDSAALPLEGAATRRLDAQLKLETIAQKYDAGEQPEGKGDQDWFYSASREQKSMLQAADVRARAGYDREEAASHDRVPVRQKSIVKNYFLNLHESEKK